MKQYVSHNPAQGHRRDDFGAISLFQDSLLILAGSPTSRSLVLMYLRQSQQSDFPAMKSMEVCQPSNTFQKVWPMDTELMILMKFHDLSFQIFLFTLICFKVNNQASQNDHHREVSMKQYFSHDLAQ